MKGIKILLLSSIAAFVLVACGSDTTSVSEESDKPKEESAEKDTEKAQTKEKDVSKEDETVQEDDQMKATNTFTNKELNIKGTVGPMNYQVSGIQLKTIEPKTQEVADLFEAKVGDVIHAFTIEMSGENTSEEDMSFYLGQAIAVTNTKEQLEPDMLLSEHIEGEYLGKVEHQGYNVYVLKNSKVEDLKSIELRISAPNNANLESVGEDVKHVIEVNN